MLNRIYRHDMLFLTMQGQVNAWENRMSRQEEDLLCKKSYPNIPAICTGRQDELERGRLRIGLSYPMKANGARHRIVSYILPDEVSSVRTPWSAAHTGKPLPEPFASIAKELEDIATSCGIAFGLFGAAALQRVTGLPYLHEGSDIDIVLCCMGENDLIRFASLMQEIERKSKIRIDAEVLLDPHSGVKLKELLGGQATVLVKSSGEPKLLSRRAAWDAVQTADKEYHIYKS